MSDTLLLLTQKYTNYITHIHYDLLALDIYFQTNLNPIILTENMFYNI